MHLILVVFSAICNLSMLLECYLGFADKRRSNWGMEKSAQLGAL